MGQDLLLHQGLLFMMPLVKKDKKSENDLVLVVYDTNKGHQKAKHRWMNGRRHWPLVYKESGEKRLYAFQDVLVQVVPADVWTIIIYRLHFDKENDELIEVIIN